MSIRLYCARAIVTTTAFIAAILPASAQNLDAETEKQLRSDAAHAWQFFERKTTAIPGLTAPNIWRNDDGQYDSYDTVTMWDAGSIVLATVSARSLGLIDDAQFDTRVRGLLDFFNRAVFTYKGKPLPNFRSRMDNAKSVEAGYDTTDTGRLFIALNVLDKATGGKYPIGDLFKKWDLKATIRDGVMHDIKDNSLEPARSNIYRFYVSRGYSLWSIDHNSVYTGDTPGISDAATEAFLKELAGIGPIATEPSAVEVVEIGPSPFTTAILDVLEKRQYERFQSTGKLTSVSETPIDRAPWFTYQGLDLSRDGDDAWTVYPYVTEKRWQTPAFAANNRVVNTKAAYLWFAIRPSEYTQKVWSYVRENAKAPEYGFHPGVYEATGKPATNIDLNTNATILESIAYIFNNRKSLGGMKISEERAAAPTTPAP